jgi:hypothetical protein
MPKLRLDGQHSSANASLAFDQLHYYCWCYIVWFSTTCLRLGGRVVRGRVKFLVAKSVCDVAGPRNLHDDGPPLWRTS